MKRTLLLCTTALSIVWGAEIQEGSDTGSERSSPKMVREDAFSLSSNSESTKVEQKSPETSAAVATLYTKEVQEKLTLLAEMQKNALDATKNDNLSSAMNLYRTLSAELKALSEEHQELRSDSGVIDLRTHALYGLVNSLWKLGETSELIPLLDQVSTIKPSENDTDSFKRMKLNSYMSCINAAMGEKDQAGYERAAELQEGLFSSLDAALLIEGEPLDKTKEACINSLHLLCTANYYLGKHEIASVVLDKMQSLMKGSDQATLVALVAEFNKENKWVLVAKIGEELEKRGLLDNLAEDTQKVLDAAKEKVAFLESAQKSLTTYMAAVHRALNPDYPSAAEALEGWLTTVNQLAVKQMLSWGVLNNVRMYTENAMTLLQVYTKMGNKEKALTLVNQVQLKWDLWWEDLQEKNAEDRATYTKSLMHQSSLYLQFSAFDEMEKILNKAAEVNPSVLDELNYLTLYLDMQILRMNNLMKELKHEEVSALVEKMMESINSLFEKFPEQKEKLLPILSEQLKKAETSCNMVENEAVASKIKTKLLEWSTPKAEAEKILF